MGRLDVAAVDGGIEGVEVDASDGWRGGVF